MRKAKAQMELHLARDVKDSKESFLSTQESKSRLGKMWAHCSVRQGAWLPRTWKKLRY